MSDQTWLESARESYYLTLQNKLREAEAPEMVGLLCDRIERVLGLDQVEVAELREPDGPSIEFRCPVEGCKAGYMRLDRFRTHLAWHVQDMVERADIATTTLWKPADEPAGAEVAPTPTDGWFPHRPPAANAAAGGVPITVATGGWTPPVAETQAGGGDD